MAKEGALSGITVLDMSRVLAGPICGMMLADLGADVIKLEVPGRGDDSRAFSPFINGESAYFLNVNRNKRGITLNLKGEGKEIFIDLVKKADILIENFRPGVMDRLGLGYETLKEINPRLIYGAVSGFGQYGPYKNRPGYDVIGQATSGLMSTTGWPGGDPTRVGTPMGDTLAGLSVTIGILAALQSRENTGKGQKVDVAILDSVIASLQVISTYYLVEGRLPERIGNRYESNYPTDSFATKDGMMVIGAANDKLWRLLCIAIGKPELGTDERYDINAKRLKNHEEIKQILLEWTTSRTTKEAVETLIDLGVPAAPINNIEQVVKDPHVKAREMFIDVEHPIAGTVKLTGSPFKLSDTHPEIRMPAPMLGQHNEEVYSELLKYSVEKIKNLKDDGVI